MNINLILRDAWRITWKNWPLWALGVLMFLAFIPAGTLTALFGLAANAVSFPGLDPYTRDLILGWFPYSGAQWILPAVIAVVLLIITTAITLLLQAASMHGVVLAAEHGRVGFVEALRLGRPKAIGILKLSLVFGLITALISVLPTLALAVIGDSSPLGVTLIHFAQTGLTPVTTLLNILALLVVMSVALEDVSPQAAFGRAGNAVRKAWWAFLLVFGLSTLAVIVSSLLVVFPVLVIIPAFVVVSPETGLLLSAIALGLGLLAAGFFFLFTAVFTQTLYALVYREAARPAVAPPPTGD